MFYKGKKVLVTGGTGLIGQPLVKMLIEQGAHVRIASMDDPSLAHPQAEFRRTNLMIFENCLEVCKGMDLVFNLVGIKGSPGVTTKKVASVFVPNLLFNTGMMEAARQADVQWYLFTSTVGVYAQAEVFIEDDLWKKPPGENDKFAGWAKRMGELQAEAYAIEYGWKRVSIVRPANVYGPYDNFDPANAMVIPSLIRRALEGENPFVVWGDGSPIRDFIHAEDVACGMMIAVEKGVTDPINLGSGTGITIKELVDIIVSYLPNKPKIVWDVTKPSGDRKRLMDTTRARSHGIEPQIPFAKGVPAVMQWYLDNKTKTDKRYNVFTEKKLV
jgi:GDP-L-fucose synthase